ncbi:hypothetical protein DNH61_06290 [Paenibacillus sambharensis]|uniref:Uncharacterized protein n=1 Tax=Paenibacillus sambharensis TaxID=1803190 RepID=A0A2W1LDC5_9BACL|nr:hypothetical protein [Paenibacillus sambharensis]PZD96803.1 hypothetical protein DNH61_06290 [Paenibacillus sambharensis]
MKHLLPINQDPPLKSYSSHAFTTAIMSQNQQSDAVPDAVFDHVSVSGAAQAGWSSADVGAHGNGGAGPFEPDNGCFSVHGIQGDITSTADTFRFVHTVLYGDGTITARLAGHKPVHVWSKAGLMIRESLEPGSKFVMTAATPSTNGKWSLCRGTADGECSGQQIGHDYREVWLRLIRAGADIQVYASACGEVWRLAASYTCEMKGVLYIGLAVTTGACSWSKWYYSNYIQLRCFKDFQSNYDVPFDFYMGIRRDRNYYYLNPYLQAHSLSHRFLARAFPDLVSFLIQCLNSGLYIDLMLDEYFIPERRAYKQTKYDHANLIYGYDTGSEQFLLLGHSPGGVFKASAASFQAVREAYGEGHPHCDVQLYSPSPIGNEYEFDIRTVTAALREYAESVNPHLPVRGFRNEVQDVYGMEVYRSLASNLPDHWRDIRPFVVLHEHKKLMIERVGYMHQQGYLSHDEQLEFQSRFLQLMSRLETLRNLIIMAQVKGTASIVHDIRKGLENAAGVDAEITRDLIGVLSRWDKEL